MKAFPTDMHEPSAREEELVWPLASFLNIEGCASFSFFSIISSVFEAIEGREAGLKRTCYYGKGQASSHG